MASAFGSGPKGRRFKSALPDHISSQFTVDSSQSKSNKGKVKRICTKGEFEGKDDFPLKRRFLITLRG